MPQETQKFKFPYFQSGDVYSPSLEEIRWKTLDEKLRDKDRVEIYRALIADPKEVRRKRAEEGKVTRKGGGDAATDPPTPAAPSEPV